MTEKNSTVFVPAQALRTLCIAIQERCGIPAADAATVADCLVEANLMGLDTHGVIRLKFYLDRVKAGGNNPNPNIRVVREQACTALLDADNALGPVGGQRAMELAIAKAAQHGIGVVVIRNCNHYGPAGHYVRMALEKNMIGLSLTNVLGSMPPTGGAEALVGNNAYAIGFPTLAEPAVVVDGATSKASWGKLFLCAQTGDPLPADCYVDNQGQMTVVPQEVMNGGALLPFAAHKGYGLAVAIELLTGMLGAAPLDHDIPHPYKKMAHSGDNTFFMAALNVGAFVDVEPYRQRTDDWIRLIRASRRGPGGDRIWLPGEKELQTRAERVLSGIPLGEKMAQELRDLAAAAGLPAVLA